VNKVKLLGLVLIFDSLSWAFGSEIVIYFRLFLYLIACISIFPISRTQNKAVSLCLLFVAYILVLSIFNTNSISNSIGGALRTIFSLLLFVYSYKFIRSMNDFVILSKYAFYSLWLMYIFIVASNIFEFGAVNYHDESIRFGESGVNISKNIFLMTIFSLPYITNATTKKQKLIRYSVIFISAVIIILAVKRTVLVMAIISLLLFVYFNRRYIGKLIFISLAVSIPIVFVFQDKITERFEVRSNRFEISNANIEKEWRVIETNIVLNRFEQGTIKTKIFGDETFNEIEAYNLPLMFHNDFALLLGGTGLIGLVLYLIFLFLLFIKYFKIEKLLAKESVLKVMYLSFIIGIIVMGIAGSFRVLGSTMSISLAGIGAIQGIVSTTRLNKKIIWKS